MQLPRDQPKQLKRKIRYAMTRGGGVTGGKWRLSSSITDDATCLVADCSNSIEGNVGAAIHELFVRSKPLEVHFLDSIVKIRSRCTDFEFALVTNRVGTLGRDTSAFVGCFFEEPQNDSLGWGAKERANCFFNVGLRPSGANSTSDESGLLCWTFP